MYVWALKKTLNSCKKTPTDNDPIKITTIGREACPKIFQGLFKALEEGNKMFQKFAETRLFKKPESIYSPITLQTIGRNKATLPGKFMTKEEAFQYPIATPSLNFADPDGSLW